MSAPPPDPHDLLADLTFALDVAAQAGDRPEVPTAEKEPQQ
jgi:hypothetical protein